MTIKPNKIPQTRSLGSDNHATVHPQIMQKIQEVNFAQVPSYGTDIWSLECKRLFKQYFGDQSEAFLVFNGTAANVISLRALVKPYQAVLVSDVSHLNNDECAAPEWGASCKLVSVPTQHGKMSVSELEKVWIRRGDQHFAQSSVISLTQPTELGTVYSLQEMKEICSWAKARGLKIHVDGARLANAACHLNLPFRAFTTDLGVDVVSFGGTKNGLMMGEAIVFCNSALAADFKYIHKQSMNLPSKSRYLAAQFLAYFEHDLWQKMAANSLQMAQLLKEKVENIKEINIIYPVESNAVFAKIPRAWVKGLREKYFFYMWDEKQGICRWMTSWDTTSDDILGFVEEVKCLIDKDETKVSSGQARQPDSWTQPDAEEV